MKKIWFALCAFSLLSATCAFGQDARSFELGVNALAAQSHSFGTACRDYRIQLGRIDRIGTAAFKTRANALAVMQRLARYPGIPAAAGKAYNAALGALPTGVNWNWFVATYESIQGACGLMQSYLGMNQLINSTRVIRFTRAERTKIRATAISFISKNMSQPAPLNIGFVQVSLFQNMLSARLMSLDRASMQSLEALMRQSDRLRAQIAERARNTKLTNQQKAMDLIYELKSANWLRSRFLPIFSKAKPLDLAPQTHFKHSRH